MTVLLLKDKAATANALDVEDRFPDPNEAVREWKLFQGAVGIFGFRLSY